MATDDKKPTIPQVEEGVKPIVDTIVDVQMQSNTTTSANANQQNEI